MDAREDLLIRAAELYYHQELSQNAIAELLGTSRPTISRMLEEARESGIVEIIIHSPIKKNPQLSKALRTALSLKDAIVIAGNHSQTSALQKCCTAAAKFLSGILDNNTTIGITWGAAANYLCDAIEPGDYYNINVVQMVGCLGTGNPDIDGLELAMKIAAKLKGTYANIYAPAFVDSPIVHSHLIAEPQIASTLKKSLHTDIVLTGIGSLHDNTSTLQRAGYLSEEDRLDLLAQGATGHLLARMFDQKGQEIPLKSKHVISAPLTALKVPSWSVGICSGKERAIAALSSVRAGYINTLICDEELANEVLAVAQQL